MPRFVPVAEFTTGAEAALAQGLLEDEGIPSNLSGGMSETWASGLGSLLSRVVLEVPEEHAERARALLDEIESRFQGRAPAEEVASLSALPPSSEGALDSVVPAHERPEDDVDEPLDDLPALTRADARARRAWICSIFALVMPIFLFVSLPLLIVALDPENHTDVTDAGRRWRGLAIILTAVGPLGWALAAWFLSSPAAGA